MQPINENAGQLGLAQPGAGNVRPQTPGGIQPIDFMTVLTDGKDPQQKLPVPATAPDPGMLPLAHPEVQPNIRMPVVPVAITAQDAGSIGVGADQSRGARLDGNGECAPALLLRLFEQHAIANPFLSVISPGQDSLAMEATNPFQTGGRVPLPAQPYEPDYVSSSKEPPLQTTFGREVAEAATASCASSDTDLPTHDWSAPLIGSVAAESQLWLQRLAKVTTSNEGKVTLWIRDYRAPVASSPEAIEAFRAYAREQGRDVHRIVMNGVEIWRHNAVQGEV